MRIDESPELFGVGVGAGTTGDITCGVCGTLYNAGHDALEDYSGDSILWTSFAGITVCECCFEAIENEVLHRIEDIMRWYIKFLKFQRYDLINKAMLVETIREST